MKFIAKATAEGGLDLGSKYNRARFKQFLKDNPGKILRIQPASKGVSDQARGYFFGALIPFLMELKGWDRIGTEEDVYEVLQKEFNSKIVYDPIKDAMTYIPQSFANSRVGSPVFQEVMLKIAEYVSENYGLTIPDPNEYENWKNSAPTL